MKVWSLLAVGLTITDCPADDTNQEPTQEGPAETERTTDDPFLGTLDLDDARTQTTPAASFEGSADACRRPILARVTRVIDGDTIDVESESNGRERVRLIGVDTPELDHRGGQDECFAREATTFTERLTGHLVWLTFDRECHDRYDRLLAYVFIGPDPSDLWERHLIRRGFAEFLVVRPNDHFADQLREDERFARGLPIGRWLACQ